MESQLGDQGPVTDSNLPHRVVRIKEEGKQLLIPIGKEDGGINEVNKEKMLSCLGILL